MGHEVKNDQINEVSFFIIQSYKLYSQINCKSNLVQLYYCPALFT
jgi:hypothetical protein